jgi:hypothetical protein
MKSRAETEIFKACMVKAEVVPGLGYLDTSVHVSYLATFKVYLSYR